MSQINVAKTFGALLIGALFASSLSGGVTVQSLLYQKLYTTDPINVRFLVFLVWFLDAFHTGLIWGSLWEYMINDYGHPERIDHIPWSLALSIILTAILTFNVHCFFAHRIYKLSKMNLYLTVPLYFFAFLRLVSATATTSEMLRLQSFSGFRHEVRWLFTLGLALSSGVDIMITGSLFYLLHASKTKGGHLDVVIDSLIIYTFETGSVTCAATIVSMICWIVKPTYLVFMGLHFVISKLYANSLLVSLNMRKNLRNRQYSGPLALPSIPSMTQPGSMAQHYDLGPEVPALILDTRRHRPGMNGYSNAYEFEPTTKTRPVEVSVERSIEYSTEYIYGPDDPSGRRGNLV